MKNISLALSSAATLLLGTVATKSLAAGVDIGEWDFKSSFLLYNETNRVSATEIGLSASKKISQRETLDFKLTLDTLTGASASGAIPTATPQTFTTPSGESTYSAGANETPLDDSFKDTRVSLSLDWGKPVSDNLILKLGGYLSNEYDYRSVSVNIGFENNFNANNSTISFGVSYANDEISPEGGIPKAFATADENHDLNRTGSNSETKDTIDALLGYTQVINKYSLFQVNYSLSQSSGYHTDPFKVLSVVDGDGVVGTNPGGNSLVVYENRPEDRLLQALFFRYKQSTQGNSVFDISYRYAFDDWEIDSHTLDFRFKKRLSGYSYLTPHLRLYRQSAANFYNPYIINSELPTSKNSYASADYRLGDLNTYTIGLEYGQDNISSPWSVALEYYKQMPGELLLNNQDLSEDIDVISFRVNYDF